MKPLAVYAVVAVLSAVLFLWLPGIDLAVSGWFYDTQHGFALAGWPPLRALEGSIRWITLAIGLAVLTGSAWLRWRGRPLPRLDRKALIFLVAATVIGPGVLVNTVLKDHWGRARPYQVAQFGGEKAFTAAPLPADQCARNCSFVSGHAALGFSLVSFALLLPAGRARWVGFGAALGFGALVGLARIAAGHHFLSDVVYAGLIAVGLTWLLHRWLVVHDGAATLIAAGARLAETANGRRLLWVAALVLAEVASIVWIDRPLAAWLHKQGAPLRPLFETVQRFGVGYPYLIASGLAAVALRWGDRRSQRLRPWAPSLHAAAASAALVFAAVAGSGIAVDILKLAVGRARPTLLFANGTYGFGWFGWRAED
ncbi:MAG: phosphatase PAP2 family protein, partial [Alphaproteobacteria bacterium]|nr:phosphatase PAP2 family protein [Alphaproteobacteria bacterium]